MPWFPVFYLYSIWSGQVTVYAFAGTDGFFFGFTLYVAFLLQALKWDVLDALRSVQGMWIPLERFLVIPGFKILQLKSQSYAVSSWRI